MGAKKILNSQNVRKLKISVFKVSSIVIASIPFYDICMQFAVLLQIDMLITISIKTAEEKGAQTVLLGRLNSRVSLTAKNSTLGNGVVKKTQGC